MTNKIDLFSYFQTLVNKGITIKILVDNRDTILGKQIGNINNATCNHNPIQLEYSNKLGNLDELTILSDGKYLFQLRFDNNNRLVATFSNEQHSVLVQELMFEKYSNEVKSLMAYSNS